MSIDIRIGDCREVLKTMPDRSVHCIVTSPPYFGLRDYGVDGQIGLEPTPEQFVAELVGVLHEARRVLRDDGTLWLNLGDSYAGSGRGGYPGGKSGLDGTTAGKDNSRHAKGSQKAAGLHEKQRLAGTISRSWSAPPSGFKQKDLIGVPWRVAFALQSDGWYLRQDIIWAKPNPMPESVTDRCTKSHEYVFLLSKAPRYFYDAEAIMEDLAPASVARLAQDLDSQTGSDRVPGKTNGTMKAVSRKRGTPPRHSAYESSDQSGVDSVARGQGRNKRSVWTVATQPYSEAHFATFPPALIEPCIKAGCPSGGTVLDPFGGAGTTGLVADRLGRNAILIEINPVYADLARNRIQADAGMFGAVA